MAKAKVGLNLQLPTDIYNDFKSVCNLKGVTMTATATELIWDYLEENRKLVDALKAARTKLKAWEK